MEHFLLYLICILIKSWSTEIRLYSWASQFGLETIWTFISNICKFVFFYQNKNIKNSFVKLFERLRRRILFFLKKSWNSNERNPYEMINLFALVQLSAVVSKTHFEKYDIEYVSRYKKKTFKYWICDESKFFEFVWIEYSKLKQNQKK